MNSDRRCGRSFSSNEESSPTGAAETRRSRFGSTSTLLLVLATNPDSRTKCESAQLQFLEVGRRSQLADCKDLAKRHASLGKAESKSPPSREKRGKGGASPH